MPKRRRQLPTNERSQPVARQPVPICEATRLKALLTSTASRDCKLRPSSARALGRAGRLVLTSTPIEGEVMAIAEPRRRRGWSDRFGGLDASDEAAQFAI